MKLRAFEARARQLWREIPAEYRDGIDGLVIAAEALPHPTLPEIYTLGECVTEAYPSDFGGPETIRSVVVLYHGSFLRLSELDPDFDWEDELWETLTHELQHHLESLAAEAGLEDFDYAADEHFKRMEGEPFDPFFFRAGTPVADGVYRVDRDVYLELPYTGAPPAPALEFAWHGRRYRAPVPEQTGDVCLLTVVAGVDTGATTLHLALTRRHGAIESVRRFLRGERVRVVEGEVEASAVGEAR